ncbi:MAG: hypothetical protein WBQ34_08475 [Candidatus Acidiferrales bacterium]
MSRTRIRVWAGVGLIASLFVAGCGGSNANVSVAITSPSGAQTIEQGQTINVSASVSGSSASTSPNVTWTLSGAGCTSAACGTLTNATGTSVTYTAPSAVRSNLVVSVMATLVADSMKSASIQITVDAITVTINNKVTEQVTNSASGFVTQFFATVQHDPASAGVSWTLTANGAPCSPACGTVSTSTYEGQYISPATVPAPPANMPTLTATSVTNSSQSDTDTFTIIDGATACATGGNEGILKGEYAIMLQGWSGSGTGTPIMYAASFAADGTGKVTGGQDQYNPYSSFAYTGPPIVSSASSYSVGPDNRGCLTLTDQQDHTFTFQFSVGGVTGGIASKGDIILDGTESVVPVRASGILRLQDPTAFSVSALAANYAFGVDGWDQSSGNLEHFAMAGSFAQSGGNLSNLAFDVNDGGTISNSAGQEPGNFGTIPTIYTATGENAVTLDLPGNSTNQVTVTVYVINRSELFFVSLTLGNGGAEFCGRAIAAPNSFSSSSISPNYVFRLTGYSSGSATAGIGLANFSGGATGTASGSFEEYSGGMASSQSLSGNYDLNTSAAGRLVITGGNEATSPTCYLTTPFDDVAAFCITGDSSASFGVFDVQPAATYTNSLLAGNFFFGSNDPADNTVSDLSGVASISGGAVTGTEDASAPAGVTLGTALDGTLSVNADGTGNMGSNTALVTNGTEIYFINEANDAPAQVEIFEP